MGLLYTSFFFFQAEDGIRDLVRSRGLGDVYKRQLFTFTVDAVLPAESELVSADLVLLNEADFRAFFDYPAGHFTDIALSVANPQDCLLYTSDAADERSRVDLGGRRLIKKKKHHNRHSDVRHTQTSNEHT